MSKVDQNFNLDLRRFRFEIGWVVLAAHGWRSYGWTYAHAARKKKVLKGLVRGGYDAIRLKTGSIKIAHIGYDVIIIFMN